jgi:lysophospholipase L1-like esterase
MKKALQLLLLPALALTSVIVTLEVALRLAPGAIPLGVLKEFEPGLRAKIASRRKLQTKEDTIPMRRDDGGPPTGMWIYKGGAEVTYEFDEPGIVRTVRMDAKGFCNPERDAYEAPTFKVLALGDSFTWCTTVAPEDAWPSVFSRMTGLSMYNLGLPGRGPYEYLQILKQYGLQKSPRFVVVDVYEGNDFRDAVRFHGFHAEAREEDDGPCHLGVAWLCDGYYRLRGSTIGRSSYAYNLVAAAIWRAVYSARKGSIDFRYEIDFADGTVVPFNRDNVDRDEVSHAKMLAEGKPGLEVFDAALQTLVELARASDFIPVVAYTPSAYTAYDTFVRFADPEITSLMRSYSARQRAYFAAQARALGYRFLDLTPAFQRAGASDDRGLLYFATNVHLTQRGHRVVAGELASLIKSLEIAYPRVPASVSDNRRGPLSDKGDLPS